MEDKPSISMEVNGPGSSTTELHKLKSTRSGTKCCVPNCDSHTSKNPELSFHKFPKDPTTRNAWLHWISRTNFQPKEYHRVCSKHFEGGKKTYLNNIPTIVPKSLNPTSNKPRTTYKCLQREFNPISTPKKRRKGQNDTVKKLQSEILELKDNLDNLESEKKKQEEEVEGKIEAAYVYN